MTASFPRISGFLCLLLLVLAPALGQAATIVVLGDSISAAYGLDNPALGWVSLLERKIAASGRSVAIVNAAISGDTTAGGLARVDALLERHRPSVLILELGANDGLRGLAPAQTRANLGEIIRRAQSRQAKVVLLGMRIPPNYGKRYNDLFEAIFPALAKEHGTGYVPFLLEGVGGHAEFMQPDGLHPNADAQPLLLQQVWERLQPLL